MMIRIKLHYDFIFLHRLTNSLMSLQNDNAK